MLGEFVPIWGWVHVDNLHYYVHLNPNLSGDKKNDNNRNNNDNTPPTNGGGVIPL